LHKPFQERIERPKNDCDIYKGVLIMALTLRLDPQEKALLDEISGFLGENTSSGTVKAMIKNYLPLQKSFDRTRFELNQIQIKHEKLCRSLRSIEDEKSRIHNLINE
jgi:hypothetical protein